MVLSSRIGLSELQERVNHWSVTCLLLCVGITYDKQGEGVSKWYRDKPTRSLVCIGLVSFGHNACSLKV